MSLRPGSCSSLEVGLYVLSGVFWRNIHQIIIKIRLEFYQTEATGATNVTDQKRHSVQQIATIAFAVAPCLFSCCTFSTSSMRISRPEKDSRKCLDTTSPVGNTSAVTTPLVPGPPDSSSPPSPPTVPLVSFRIPPRVFISPLHLRRATFLSDTDGVKHLFAAARSLQVFSRSSDGNVGLCHGGAETWCECDGVGKGGAGRVCGLRGVAMRFCSGGWWSFKGAPETVFSLPLNTAVRKPSLTKPNHKNTWKWPHDKNKLLASADYLILTFLERNRTQVSTLPSPPPFLQPVVMAGYRARTFRLRTL